MRPWSRFATAVRARADALAIADRKLAAGARAFVDTVSPADILRPQLPVLIYASVPRVRRCAKSGFVVYPAP
jgi:hypothetical protein